MGTPRTRATKLAHLFAATTAVTGGLTLLASPAEAAGCKGSGCRGRDPMAAGCADSKTRTLKASEYKAENSASYRMEIRYSPTCQAAWARLIRYSGHDIGFALSAWNPGKQSVGVSGRSGATVWTSMVPASATTEACAGTQFYVNGSWKRWEFLGCRKP